MVLLFIAVSSFATAEAQNSSRFSITRSVIAGGGATFSTSSRFQLAGTVGQPVPPVPQSSRFSIQSGFWTWQAPAVFAAMKVGTNFVLSFETQPGKTYTLEYTDSLNAPNWQSLPSVAGNGSIRTVTTPAGDSGERFYRVREE